MRFQEYKTGWDRLSQSAREAYSNSNNYYKAVVSDCKEKSPGGSPIIQQTCLAEAIWMELGRPYYKVWPAYLHSLIKSTVEVPTELFKVPHQVFSICLPRVGVPWELKNEKVCVVSVLCFLFQNSPIGKPNLLGVRLAADDGTAGYVSMSLDRPLLSDCYQSARQKQIPSELERLILAGLRLAVSVSMLATSVHRSVEHDVIEKLRERYDAAKTDAERQSLADKSKRRGVFGFRIGRGRCLGLTTQHGDKSEGGGNELSFQHIRGGHFHTVLHGPSRSLRKVVFFEPTIVRPDLPVKPIAAD